MKILLAVAIVVVLCLLVIIYNQMQVEEVSVQPVPVPAVEPATSAPSAVIEQQPQLRRVLRERIYWQESPEYYHWRTSIKTSIEDARPPEYSGRWVTEYYWAYK